MNNRCLVTRKRKKNMTNGNAAIKNINADIIRNIAAFLHENEQYGDDWSEEIAELDKVIDLLDSIKTD